jgi:hypothetical protein
MILQVLSALVILSNGAPSGTLLGAEQLGITGIAAAPAVFGYTEIAPAVTAVRETINAGPSGAEFTMELLDQELFRFDSGLDIQRNCHFKRSTSVFLNQCAAAH